MKKFCTLILFFLTFLSFSQKKYPTDYFSKPVDIPIILAGTFGELRSNHFHAGIDIKTNQKEGLNVYATADGYVSRIKVALWGYGKVLYVTHPNGFTTVYAHLSKFNKEIERFVKADQYKKESYETGNIFLKPNQIPVKKGEVIALSGSTGGFIAPHLHYEIRDTETEKIINPMLFGLLPKDDIAPKVKNVFVYPIANASRINQSEKKLLLPLKKVSENSYTTSRISASGKIGFGIDVYDQLNFAYNKNGIYRLELFVNGKQHYQHDLETFSFAKSKFINLLIDYEYYSNYKARFQRLFKAPKNTLNIYKNLVNNGYIDIQEGLNYSVEIVAADFKGNKTSIKIPIKGVKSNTLFKQVIDTTAYKIIASDFHKFEENGVTVAFPKNTFYDDLYLDFKVEKDKVKVHTPTVPLDKSFTLTFDVTKFSEDEKKQLYIANVNNEKFPSYQNTRKKNDTFFTTTKTLGNYTLLTDNQSPKIKLKSFKDEQWLSNHKTLTVQIEDNESGIKSYRATINGEWILMEYNLKKKLLTYDFSDKKLVGSKHVFKIEVLDNVGNTNTLSATFY